MSLTRIQSFEEVILSTIRSSGHETVADLARDMMDASANILLRLEGARSAADFTFALEERMVAKVLGQPTNAPIHLPQFPAEIGRASPREPYGTSATFFWGYAAGLLCGAVWGIIAWRAL